MKKYLPVLLLVILIVPSVALASWWNPFTWKIFQKKETVPQVQVETKTADEKITEMQKQIDDFKKQQTESDTKTVQKDTEKVTIPIVTKETDPEKLWKLWEDYNFPIADGKALVSLVLTQPSLKETRYYRKEGNQWVRKNSEAEASQPYSVNTQAQKTAKTGDQICQDRFGIHSVVSDNKDANGNRLCSCENGYEINSTGTSCQKINNNPDPYGVLYGTGIQYSPEQLNDIDCSYYGRNCPTLHIKIDN